MQVQVPPKWFPYSFSLLLPNFSVGLYSLGLAADKKSAWGEDYCRVKQGRKRVNGIFLMHSFRLIKTLQCQMHSDMHSPPELLHI